MNGNDTSASKTKMSLFQKLLRMLALTRERELTCAEVGELLDYYTELEKSGENVKSLMPAMAQHLQICPECEEEHQALRRILDLESGNGHDPA